MIKTVDNITFSLRKRGYYRNNGVGKLSRYIYEKENGYIPQGYVVHHKNFNKEDDSINNLELMSNRAHKKMHAIQQMAAQRRLNDITKQ